jgi:hypothetical protein
VEVDGQRRKALNRLPAKANLDKCEYRWYQAWIRVKPWDVSAETEYSIGGTGVGTAWLHSSLAQKGQDEAILFSDNLFPSARDEIAKGALR